MNRKLKTFGKVLNNLYFKNIDRLPHKEVLIKKLDNTRLKNDSFFHTGKDLDFFIKLYIDYITKLKKELDNKPGFEKRKNMIALFQDYQKSARLANRTLLGKGFYFTAQSKYESTIIEEFLILYFKDLICDNLKIGSVKIKSTAKQDIYFDEKTSQWKSQTYNDDKDQDLAIYFECNGEKNLLVAAEIKSSYIDKTMVNGITNTFKDIHKENAKALTMIISEAITLDKNYIFEPNIGIYCLKKIDKRDENSEIDFSIDVFEKMYNDVENHLLKIKNENMSNHQKLMTQGFI